MNKPNIPVRLTCDDFRIGKVMRNLLSNTLKYKPKHKLIELSISKSSLPKDRRFSDMITISGLLISVNEEGVGIPGAERISVFECETIRKQRNLIKSSKKLPSVGIR